MKGQEVRALLALHVDDLDVLPLLDLVGERRRLVHAEVEARLGERRRQLQVDLDARLGALDLHDQRRRGQLGLAVALPGRGHHGQDVALGHQGLGGARRAVGPEQAQRAGLRRLQPAGVENA